MADILTMREIDSLLSTVNDDILDIKEILEQLLNVLYTDKKLSDDYINIIKNIYHNYYENVFIDIEKCKNIDYIKKNLDNICKELLFNEGSIVSIDINFLKTFISKFYKNIIINLNLYNIKLLLFEINEWDSSKCTFMQHLEKYYPLKEDYDFNAPLYKNINLSYFTKFGNEFDLNIYALKRKEYNTNNNITKQKNNYKKTRLLTLRDEDNYLLLSKYIKNNDVVLIDKVLKEYNISCDIEELLYKCYYNFSHIQVRLSQDLNSDSIIL